MVTQALANHLSGLSLEKQLEWFSGLEALSDAKTGSLRDLFASQWPTGDIGGGAEKPFTLNQLEERGAIPELEFKTRFWSKTPDFRYWTTSRDKQLIVEAKGTSKPSQARDTDQARRYFEYLCKRPSIGVVAYLVLNNAKIWHEWLQRIATEETRESVPGHVGFAVIHLDKKVLAQIAPQLIRVVGESLVKAANLLDRAFKLGS